MLISILACSLGFHAITWENLLDSLSISSSLFIVLFYKHFILTFKIYSALIKSMTSFHQYGIVLSCVLVDWYIPISARPH